MQYHNLDIWVDARDRSSLEYHVRAYTEKADSASGLMHLDLASPEVSNILERFSRRQTDRQFLSAAGTLLFDAVFPIGDHRVYDLFQRCLDESQRTAENGFRLRLRIEAPEMAALPWEFLYVQSQNTFLSTWTRTPLVRYLDVGRPVPHLEMSPPVRMLVVLPDNPRRPGLNAAGEKEILHRALEGMQSYVIPKFLEGAVSLDDVEDALGAHEFHIFHFIGHGDFDGNRGVLELTDGVVDQDQWGQLFQNHEQMKLVVLNACKGAQVSSSQPFLGLAPQLVRKGIPAVVAMQYAIYDDVALHFARRFYQSLFEGECQGKVDLALTQARNSLCTKYPDQRAFGAPVLFLRSPEGVLFHGPVPRTVPARLKKVPRLLATREAHGLEASARTHMHNRRAIQDSDLDPQTKASRVHDAEEHVRQIYTLLQYQSLAAAALVAFILFCMSWVNLFDLAHLDTTMESWTMALGDHFAHKQFTDKIVVIPIDEEVEEHFRGTLGTYGTSWRGSYAQLTTRLSEAGAKVIVFDMSFKEDNPELDGDFSRAIVEAREDGTAVIIGVNRYDGNEPVLANKLKQAASGWGSVQIGRRGYARLSPLVNRKAQAAEPVFGLALRAFAAYRDADRVEVVDLARGQTRVVLRFDSPEPQTVKLHIFESETIDADRASNPNDILDTGDLIANMAIDRTPLGLMRDKSRRYSYTDILEHPEPAALTDLRDKIVVMGAALPRLGDFDRDRWGFEVHADAINTLLNGVEIRPVAPRVQLALMMVFAVLGATIRARTRHVSRRLGITLMIVVPSVYFTGALYLYVQHRLLLNIVYHVVSLMLTYWLVGKLERRYFQWERHMLASRGDLGG